MSHALRVRGLALDYGRRQVLRGLDLDIPAGSVFGFLGRNAAGKTTTLRVLIGVLRSRAGDLELFGEKVARVTPELRRRIGYVSQEQHFYEWMRVHELGALVASFYPTWSDERFRALLERTAIERDQRVGELSGGTKMKLAIVLALAHDPPLLVLDEPTAGVDPAVRREVLALLAAQARLGRTILFSTHQIEEVRAIASHVGILHGGRTVFQGRLDEAAQRFRRVTTAPDGARVLAQDEHGALVVDAPPEVWATAIDAGAPLSLEDLFFFATGGHG
ncbi:ABC transporter ATP-binding protein [Myxococcota bacterium]|nr:ABC transporter ATP-binding protein [Myxococcota bacterium]